MDVSRHVHRIGRRRTSAALLAATVAASCGDDAGIPDGPVLSTGFVDDDGSIPPPGGADETGEGSGVSAHCLYDPKPLIHAYRYQCAGSIFLDLVVTHPFEGSPETEPFELTSGQGVDGDEYLDPLVMACCPEYDVDMPNCGQPHERACFVDLIEQGCKSMVAKLEDFAHERFPGLSNAPKRNAVLEIASYVRDHQAECVAAFRDDTGIAAMPASCDEDLNGPGYTSLLEDGYWSFDPDGLVELVEIDVAQAEWHGLFPIGPDTGTLAECSSADDNDDVMFLELDPATGSKALHLIAGSVHLVGPGAEGTGELGSTSTLAVGPESLQNLALHSAGAAMIVAGDATLPVDTLHVRLWDRAHAEVERQTLTVQPGEARFVVSATALGHNAVQTASNATPITITRGADGWRTSSFILAHGEWSLVVAPGRWQ